MTAGRFLRPKLRPPVTRPGLQARPRLLERLDAGLAGQFRLIVGPAGYGKTTLLAQWIGHQGLPAAWLTLDQTDNEPTLLLEELVEAVSIVYPDSCQTIRSLLGRPLPPPLELLLRELTNDLDDLDEFILVLDDCHLLKDPHTCEILRHLAYQPPSSLHLVLASRADPLLPLGALRGRGLLNELRAADLRFSYEEGEAYLREAFGRPLSEAQCSSLMEWTEGWIAGLHLAALSLRDREDVEQGIRAFAGSGRFVTDYLMDELWNQLDPAVQYYLEATSILERLTAPLCRAVIGDGAADSFEGRPMLEWLEDRNLFVASLDEQRTWFRYHHLLRDLLLRLLNAHLPTEDVAALHVRAAEWFSAHDQVEEAVGHFVKAGRPESAADAVEAHARSAIEQERWPELQRWVGMLGSDIVDARPRLVMIHAWLAAARHDLASSIRLCERAERLLDQSEQQLEDDMAIRGEIATMRAEVSFYVQGRGDEALLYARSALESLPRDYQLARATASWYEGGGLYLLGRIDESLEAFRRASFGDYGEIIHPRAMVGLCVMAFMTGDVDYAGQCAKRMLREVVGRRLGESAGWAHYFLGLAAYLRNDLTTAEEHYTAVEPYGSHLVALKQSYYGLAWVQHARGAADESLGVLDQFARLVSDLGISLGPEIQLLRARLSVLSGWPTDSAGLARGIIDALDDGPVSLQVCYEFGPISAISILASEGGDDDLPACQAVLRRLLATAETNGNVFRSVQCLVLQALVLDRQDRTPEALVSLAQAVALAKPGRLVRLFPEMGDRVHSLLRALRPRGGGDAFLDGLIASFEEEARLPDAASQIRPAARSRDDQIDTLLSNRELDVLILLEERLSNKEIARRLVISPSTVKRHTLSIYAKLGVGGRREAVAKARRLGVLPVSP